jgi:thiol:disulfide interchange protein
MLADALAKAKATDKRVFLIASASWCGPCRMLSRFLSRHKPELERHYVFVKLDVSRDEHGDAVRDRHQKDRDGGIPWYVILDADGGELTTSNLPESAGEDAGENIGYPGGPTGAEHFLTMLQKTAPGLSDEVLASLRADLEKGR